MGDATTNAHRRQRTISRFTTSGNERGVDPIGRKFAGYIQHVVATTVSCCIRAEIFDKSHPVFSRGYSKHAGTQSLCELYRKVSDAAAGAEDHHRLVRSQ